MQDDFIEMAKVWGLKAGEKVWDEASSADEKTLWDFFELWNTGFSTDTSKLDTTGLDGAFAGLKKNID